MATRRVHGLQQRLEADVAHQLVIHLVLIFKQVTVPTIMTLATFLTHPRPTLRHPPVETPWAPSWPEEVKLDVRRAEERLCHFLSLQTLHQLHQMRSNKIFPIQKENKLLAASSTPKFLLEKRTKKTEAHVKHSFLGSCRLDRK